MAVLSPDQIVELVKKPFNQEDIKRAKEQSKRLKFHTEATTVKKQIVKLSRDFLEWVASFLEDEAKRVRFATFLQNPPIATVETTEKIWKKLGRIWHTQDSFRGINFRDQEEDLECEEYLNKINLQRFIRTDCYQEYQVSPNSFVVVDMPQEQEGELPDPKAHIVSLWVLIDYRNSDEKTEYIIFEVGKKEDLPNGGIAAFDDETFRLFPKDNNGQISSLRVLEEPHILGRCPAYQIGKKKVDPLNDQFVINEVVPSLSGFDFFLYKKISKKYLDSYMMPVMDILDKECTYEGCQNGKVSRTSQKTGDVIWDPCPICAENDVIGAGSVHIKPPATKEDPDVGDSVSFITPDVDYLEWADGNIGKMEEVLIANCAGVLDVEGNQQAKNEDQIAQSFENRIDVLIPLSETFEWLEENVSEAICVFRTGNPDGEVTINNGTDFFLRSVDDLMNEFKIAKEAGLPESEQIRILEKIIETKYKNNDILREEAKILLNLEPFPTLDISELKELGIDVADPEAFRFKLQFNELVKRFEREQMNVRQFGSEGITFDQKIRRIKDVLLSYVREQNINESAEIEEEANT